MTLSKNLNINTGASSMFSDESDEEINFKISNAAFGHVMNSLSSLYENPVMSMVRELYSNAVDANRQSGVNRPVEMTFPNMVTPHFVITDHGSGMDYDVLSEVYTNFGVSRKTDDFDAIGSYGYGAKSPMSIADSYEVVTTKDGVTRTCVITKSDTIPKMSVKVEETGAESGTTVRVPVNSDQFIAFAQEAERYASRSISHPVIVNGVEHYGYDDFIQIDNIVLNEESGISSRVWVSTFDNTHNSIGFVLNNYIYSPFGEASTIIEIFPGMFDFTPSRDTIVDNNKFDNIYRNIVKILGDHKYLANMYKYLHNAKDVYSIKSARFKMDMTPNIVGDNVVFGTTNASLPLADFTSKDGSNLLAESLAFKSKVVFSALISKSNHLFENGELISPTLDFKINYDSAHNLTELKSRISKRLSYDEWHNTLGYVATSMSPIFAKGYESYPIHRLYNNSHIVIISVKDAKEAKRILLDKANRDYLFAEFSGRFSDFKIIAVDSAVPVTDAEKEFVKKVSSLSEYKMSNSAQTYMTFKELVENAAGPLPEVPDNPLTVIPITTTGFDSMSDFLKIDDFEVNKFYSVSKYADKNPLYVITNNSSSYLSSMVSVMNAINGYAYAVGEEHILNRPIISVISPKVQDFKSLGDLDNIIFDKEYSTGLRFIKDNMKDRVFNKAWVQSIIDNLSNQDRVGVFVNHYGLDNNIHLVDRILKVIPDFSHEVVNCQESLHRKFPPVSIGLISTDTYADMKQILRDSEWEGLLQMIAFNSIFGSYKAYFQKLLNLYKDCDTDMSATFKDAIKSEMLQYFDTEYDKIRNTNF